MELPLTAYELIDELDRTHPEVIYDPHRFSHEEFLMKSGERRLILRLKALRDAENSR